MGMAAEGAAAQGIRRCHSAVALQAAARGASPQPALAGVAGASHCEAQRGGVLRRTLMRHRKRSVTPRMYSLGCCRLLRRFWQIRICKGAGKAAARGLSSAAREAPASAGCAAGHGAPAQPGSVGQLPQGEPSDSTLTGPWPHHLGQDLARGARLLNRFLQGRWGGARGVKRPHACAGASNAACRAQSPADAARLEAWVWPCEHPQDRSRHSPRLQPQQLAPASRLRRPPLLLQLPEPRAATARCAPGTAAAASAPCGPPMAAHSARW